MIRRPPRSTLDRSSAASDVYKRQTIPESFWVTASELDLLGEQEIKEKTDKTKMDKLRTGSVSYTHLRAHETVLDLVCRLLLEKKKKHT